MRLHVLAIRSWKRSRSKKKLNDDEDRYFCFQFLRVAQVWLPLSQFNQRLNPTDPSRQNLLDWRNFCPCVESSKSSVAPFCTSPRATFRAPKALRVLGRTIRSSLWNLWDEADQALTMFVICDDFFCSQNPSQWICVSHIRRHLWNDLDTGVRWQAAWRDFWWSPRDGS